eukprot:CAMPEP_0185004000 /NCGR_PEP_ID=MMETSP1098-20130426/78060_1 /TAXON_ID=89044 /ORGANISM="Spumella elongata, Strain CCAP 955/1" /LENGTH=72 /DNA_ID=CAMNT_0027531749 /DNA_START=98 /DNA_END=316 /DNA_ORIENTATION=-
MMGSLHSHNTDAGRHINNQSMISARCMAWFISALLFAPFAWLHKVTKAPDNPITIELPVTFAVTEASPAAAR